VTFLPHLWEKEVEISTISLPLAHCGLCFAMIQPGFLDRRKPTACLGKGSIMKRLAVALLAAASVGFGVAGMASAADLGRPMPMKAPAMIMADDWAGFYIGGHLGAAWSRSGYTYDNGVGLIEPFGFDPNSIIGGGHAGLQGQWGTWVLGIEGSFDGTDLSQTDTSVLAPPRTRSLKIDEIATVTGRLGYAIPGWLFYVKGGWAGVHENNSSFNPANGITHSFSDWNSGYTVGGGIEYKLTRNWILGAEFNFYNAKFDRSGSDSAGNAVSVFNSNADIYSVLFRASYLFK
jgi:outer membrane immunogenic protein